MNIVYRSACALLVSATPIASLVAYTSQGRHPAPAWVKSTELMQDDEAPGIIPKVNLSANPIHIPAGARFLPSSSHSGKEQVLWGSGKEQVVWATEAKDGESGSNRPPAPPPPPPPVSPVSSS